MSSSSSQAAQQAQQTSKGLAEQYYGIAIPALQQRLGSINVGLETPGGLPEYMQQAYAGQRTNLAEGLTGAERANIAGQAASSKGAVGGGNVFAGMSTSDIGSQLANALYGSKFQEGQAGINQTMNLMSMALGGAGTSGNAALTASGNELAAIRYLPNYNPTYANVMGGLAGASSIYGALNQPGASPFAGNVMAPSLQPGGVYGQNLGQPSTGIVGWGT